jgi:hypothetical protein
MYGLKSGKVPVDLTTNIPGTNWNTPFNNKYVNQRRQAGSGGNPLGIKNEYTIDEIVKDIATIAKSTGEETSPGSGRYRWKVTGMRPSPTPPPTPKPDVSDVKYTTCPNKNAYSGFGAEDIDTTGVEGLSEEACKERCSLDTSCDCVTQLQGGTGACFKRKNCNPKGWTSEWNAGHNVYVKGENMPCN